MATKGEKSHGDVEAGPHRPATDDSDDSLCFSDAEDQSWHSPYNSNRAGSAYDEYRFSGSSHHEIDGVPESCRKSCASDRSVETDLESGIPEIKANKDRVEKDCRICHLSLEGAAPESGIPIVLGCSCKGDLGAAHKQCAETWFKIKGNNAHRIQVHQSSDHSADHVCSAPVDFCLKCVLVSGAINVSTAQEKIVLLMPDQQLYCHLDTIISKKNSTTFTRSKGREPFLVRCHVEGCSRIHDPSISMTNTAGSCKHCIIWYTAMIS
ncbi:uncharacterized protein [Elaeis guineensis]|uniref:uncharacterized protein isoform X1 n=1 Tax=Elaeis guineensis var. tenera TaxID=51953 RepID=UPI003C6D225C